MGTNHVSDFLMIEPLIFLQHHPSHHHIHTHTHTEPEKGAAAADLAYVVIKEVEVLPLMLSQILLCVHR